MVAISVVASTSDHVALGNEVISAPSELACDSTADSLIDRLSEPLASVLALP